MPGKLQFGVYELDRDAMELRKHGVPIRLQEQPLRVLISLVERPGEIVTREELQERIWGKDTFVDFEQSLNKAVNRVREALNDDANQPRYVETVPRRGYRFIAPVIGPIPLELTAPTTALSPVSDVASTRAGLRRRQILILAILASACVFIAIGVAAVLLWKRMENHPTAEIRHITSAPSCCPRLSRDGKLLLYVTNDSHVVNHVYMQQTAGGEAIQVTNGAEGETTPDFSPDGTHIVFVSGGGLYIKPTFSGEPKLIAKGVSVLHPIFSPNGEKVSYVDQEKGIAVTVSVDTGESKPIHTKRDLFVRSWLGWSPRGDEVIFEAFDQAAPGKPLRWWIVPLASGEARPLDLPADNFAHPVFELWMRAKDGADSIIYSEGTGEQWRLFRIRVFGDGRIAGKPQQLISGIGSLAQGHISVSSNGKLAYSTFNVRETIFQIPIGGPGESRGPTIQLLPDADVLTSPALSRDGGWMAYDSWRPGKSNTVMVRDLKSGTDRSLDELDGKIPGRSVTISLDGSKVIFKRDCKGNLKWLDGLARPCSFMMSVAGGESEQICEMCDARGFSSNGSVVLFQKYNQDVYDKPPPRIASLDLTSKTEREFLRNPDKPLYHAFFSWDDHWVVFKKLLQTYPEKSQLLIAPVQAGVAGEEPTWIPITDGNHNDDKPQFSPDGNLVYFTSTRDGYLCIWSQKLDPATKKPLGDPVAYEHFHSAVGRDAAQDIGDSDLSVARDKMVINLPEFSFNIWMTQLE